MTRPACRSCQPLALALAGLLALAGCAPGALPMPGPSDLVKLEIPCPPLLEASTEARLYFGLGAGAHGEPVGEADWQAFVDEVVTPRFPDGLTVLDGYGQWRADATAPIGREASKVLVIVLPDLRESLPDLRALAGLYKHRFRQQSVLLTAKPVCAAF